MKGPAPRTSDYFAELYVAGRFAEAGWNVYFPHRDQGFDFIVSKLVGNEQLIRPVQVKGKYPTAEKRNWPAYGYVGKLSQLHPDMVLAIPYFPFGSREMPLFTAYLPPGLIKKHSRGYRCEPASFRAGAPAQRKSFDRFFGESGLELVASGRWHQIKDTKSC
jgi:hypothetical protein